MKNFVRNAGFTAIAAMALATYPSVPALAQDADYPDSNISITIPTGEGGGADRDARAITKVWAKYLERNSEFSYYPGAAGQVGYEFFMKSKADGTHLMFSNIGPEVIMLELQDVPITIGEDLVYIQKTSTEPMAIWVGANSKFETLQQLIEEAKERPVTISVSRLPHPASIGMLALGEATGAEFNLIPYGGGNPTAMAAITGEVDASALPLANPITLGPEARVLGIFADENPVPDQTGNAPTVNEAAGTDLPALTSSRAFAVQASVLEEYPERVELLKKTIRETLVDPDYVAAVAAAGVPVEFIDPGDQEAAMAEAAATAELATKYRDLLTGE
ncbi:tripartite tricarboxylate transporter substrate-binding protein [Paracoccus onubensis]|uniref:Bug family tripartite tricarboxylate transporter substrate binding protein n=1 Tax=Paracoccus onubensis TaxID=1675788 RepID=UPI00273033AD|nr:tripartite tricarboxylate transporter substrate-binding protein [Paracoccus onubensis]MDP0929564.1 tripartite tricarboxylate transporter substrate-binding protein [Paracoccus onubensis]